MKIIGNTVGMGLPKPNLMQTDPSKGDYVKGKEQFLQQVGAPGGAVTDQGKRPGRLMVSFMDDDCRAAVAGPENDQSLEYLIDQKQIPYTLACAPGDMVDENKAGRFITLDDLQRMVSKGVTVSCHAWRQYNMDQFATEDAFRADLEAATALFNEWGIPVETMSYPQGKYVDEYIPTVKDFYRMGFTVADGINEIPYASYYMNRVGLFEDDANDDGTASFEEAKGWVDQLAEMESGWLVFMTHAWYKGFRPALLSDLIDYIQSEEIRSKGIEIVDIHEALDSTGNVVEVGRVKKPLTDQAQPFFVVDAAGVTHTNALHKYTRSTVELTELHPNWTTGTYLRPAGGKADHSDRNRIVSLDIPVQPGEVYRLTCAAEYVGNLLFAIYDTPVGATDVTPHVMEGYSYPVPEGKDYWVLTNHEITIPDGATYMRVSGNLNEGIQPDGYKIYRVEYVGGADIPEEPGDGSGSSQNVELDTTLTQSGKAADAKAVGDKFAEITGISLMEPAEDDIPKVFITGVKPTTKDDVLAEMQYISKTERFHAYLEIKCQGSSSLSKPKKNFTVKLYSDEARETKQKKTFKDWNHASNKFVLKANFIDHSHARNIVSARIWDEVVKSRTNYAELPEEMRNSPQSGAIDGFPVKLYYNDTYEGLYTWNIGKDAWMWGMDEDNPKHALLSCGYNDNGVLLEKAGNFRALWSGVHEDNWDIEVGTQGSALTASMNALISCVKDTDDETFKATIGQYLDINSALDYYLYFWANAGLDSLENNMLLATYDGVKWICGAYDMDSVWGLHYTGSSFIATDFKCPDQYQGPYSLLWERITKLFIPELQARYAELRSGVLSYPNIVTHFERFMDVIGLDLYAEDLTIYTGIPSGGTNNIKQIRNYVRDRLVYVDAEVSAMEPPADPIPCTGITLSASELTFTGAGTQTLTATAEPENTTDSVVWTSNDNSVATVANGVVTAKSNGNATIAATCGGYSASCSVSVSGIESGEPGGDDDIITVALTAGIALKKETGDTVAYSGTYTSDFIELDEGYTHRIHKPEGASSIEVLGYDASKVYEGTRIGSSELAMYDVGPKDGRKYIRFTVYSGVAVQSTRIEKINPDSFGNEVSTDTEMIRGYKLDNNGKIINWAAENKLCWAVPTFYPVEEGVTYTVDMGSGSQFPGVMLYDENFVSLGEVGTANGTSNTFTVSAGAKYARWMCMNNNATSIIATVTKA